MKAPWQITYLFRPYVRSISGTENIPAGRCIIVANHQSSLDTLMLMLAFRRKITFVADHRLLKTVVRRYVTYTVGEAIPNGLSSTEFARVALRDGETVCIFPEGDIHPKYRTEGIRSGAAVLSHGEQIPVVPVRLTGTGRVWPVVGWPLRPWLVRSVRIAVGKPIDPPPVSEQYHYDDYQKLSRQFMETIEALG
ncbi:MAG: lysophospholipid acyltransferase family protein [Patescibacteria group bacterium]